MSRQYVLRRVLLMIPSIFGISIVLFTVLALAPGDPFSELAANPAIPPEVAAALRAKFGLDDPVWTRYYHWLLAMVQGDWGFLLRQPHQRRHADPAAPADHPGGDRCRPAARHPGRPAGRRAGRYAALLDLRPDRQHARLRRFLAADLLHRPAADPGVQRAARLAADGLPRRHQRHRLEMGVGADQAVDHAGGGARLFQGASLVRYVRSAVLDVVRLDYVTTARSKGIGERAVTLRHIVRTALIPVVTLIALQLPVVFGGALVTEQIFRVPGIGSLLISAMLSNDTPVVMAVTFVLSCLVVLFNFFADIIYGWLDPRISYR
jgi:peptide/nickel transport system permease protein